MSESAQTYAQDREKLEAEHQARVAELSVQGADAMIAEEQRKHDEAIRLLDAQMAKQQQVQEQAMGQMMLQAFDAWGEQKDIPVEKMIEMRTAIAEEYGLVGKGSTELVNDMVSEWDQWAVDMNTSTEDVVSYLGAIIDETGKVEKGLLDLTAREYTVRVRYEMNEPVVRGDLPEGPGLASGGQFMVGERGPEVVTVQPLGGNSYTYNEHYHVANAGAMAAHEETRRRRRASMGRTM